jgi:hypothetical protein
VIYFCSDKNRRSLVLAAPGLNGIDFLEVVGPNGCGRQLALTLLKDARGLTLSPNNMIITGGAPVQVVSISPATNDDCLVLTINLEGPGDFSPYQLAVVAGPGIADPPDGFDPQLSTVSFSFKAGCPTPADCLPDNCCPAPVRSAPDINYLAKDYGGFRQVMLDRLAVLVPGWTETHAADLGVAMVETLAYAADHLSYQQDAVSTEAYIGTARSRISLRRHAKLVDYTVGEGCNARVFVFLTLSEGQDDIFVPAGTTFYVEQPGVPVSVRATDIILAQQLTSSPHPIFSSLEDRTLYGEQNEMNFYTWGDADCCLPPGATEATLLGYKKTLHSGDILLFEEVLGPETGNAADANAANRCVVLLTGVSTSDYKGRPLIDPLTGFAITRITWSADDALPFPICISSITDSDHGSVPVFGVSVAHGNIVPADHGITVTAEVLPPVPLAPPAPPEASGCSCNASMPTPAPIPRFHPQLANGPLTFSQEFYGFSPATNGLASAAAFLAPDPKTAKPQISLSSSDSVSWTPLTDLLSSTDIDAVFAVEVERDGTAFLRFGDDQYGEAPNSGVTFTATYRVGNGSVGNIGRDSLGHLIIGPDFPSPPGTVISVRNPLGATGGVDAESMDHIVQYAPFSYETQLRCVTEADYGDAASALPGIHEARGTLRWTGSWYTAFVSIDPVATITTALVRETTSGLNLLRMMGTDLAVEEAKLVGLRIEMEICVDPDHFQGDVFEALMQLFISGDRCNGQPGLLNSSNFIFGETVYTSPLIAAAQAVEGVLAATLTVFARMDAPVGAPDGVATGYLTMGRLEIPRCDNDPNHLDLGLFVLHMDGGK